MMKRKLGTTALAVLGLGMAVHAQSADKLNAQQNARETNSLPSFYKGEMRFEFKRRISIESPGNGYYSSLLTFAPWGDTTGGRVFQMNFNGGGYYIRRSAENHASWETWREFFINGNSLLEVGANNGTDFMASKIYLNSHNNYRGTGIFSIGQTNKWFMGNAYTDHANAFMIGVAPASEQTDAVGQKKYAKFFMDATGNVGIGSTTPGAKLHVVNGNNSYGAILATANEFKFNLYAKTLGTTNTNDEAFRFGMKYDADERNGFISFYRGGSSNGGFLGLSTNGAERMLIDANGNVGIGTKDTHGYKLGVKGKIAAEEVKVALYGKWPDFVFEENYDLPTLAEVEAHIREKGHLINIPSAKEVEIAQGIELGEMNKKLLQKIEELTLYTLQQERQLKEQQTTLKVAEETNKKLLLLLSKLEQRVKKLEKE
ncbi:hypothetical protein [Tenacibaculum litopenaei]|uniref:hypothetical protein n=1 Tax=Tenacibaculum litopenaei TaxID=396016 RepID=UPI0038B562CB